MPERPLVTCHLCGRPHAALTRHLLPSQCSARRVCLGRSPICIACIADCICCWDLRFDGGLQHGAFRLLPSGAPPLARTNAHVCACLLGTCDSWVAACTALQAGRMYGTPAPDCHVAAAAAAADKHSCSSSSPTTVHIALRYSTGLAFLHTCCPDSPSGSFSQRTPLQPAPGDLPDRQLAAVGGTRPSSVPQRLG
jgi:hypothetical protein